MRSIVNLSQGKGWEPIVLPRRRSVPDAGEGILVRGESDDVGDGCAADDHHQIPSLIQRADEEPVASGAELARTS